MKILILTEGGEKTGFGHITRCLSLYQAIEAKKIKPKFIINGDESIKSICKGADFIILNWLNERKRLLDELKNTDIVIIDSYLADSDLYITIKKKTNTMIILDDNNRLEYPADSIIVNGAINAATLAYPKDKIKDYLIGPLYQPIRKSFWNISQKHIAKNINSILIMFGGTNVGNLIIKIYKSLLKKYPQSKKVIILGGSKSVKKDIESILDSNTKLINEISGNELKKIMLNSDLAVSGAGQTLYELACVGVPTIAIGLAKNQLNNIRGWSQTNFIKYAGWYDDSNLIEKFELCLKKIEIISERKIASIIGRKIIDGKGSLRIIKRGLNKFFINNIILRKVNINDIKSIYELSNEPEVRKVSFNNKPIKYDEHIKWFTEKIKNKNCIFLIVENNSNIVAQLRYDLLDNEAVISISIHKHYRGFGLGEIIFKKSLIFLRNKKNVFKIRAFIKKENISSINFFKKLNFIDEKKTNLNNSLEFIYKL